MDIKIPIARVELGKEEIGAAVAVLESGRLVQGEVIRRFEEDFALKVGARYAVAVSSGTAALHIAYQCLLDREDEVLVPAFSHISTASMVSFVGARPVFCDIDPNTFTIEIDEIKDKLTNKTRAIAGVHLFGNACQIDEILDIADNHGLKVIWDAAQAQGTLYKGQDIGSFPHVVCYSFYPTKNMIVGEGGMITTNDEAIHDRLKLIRSHGQEKKYYHTMLGFNYRMTEVEAAIGIEQLKKLDHMLSIRRSNAAMLSKGLGHIKGLRIPFSHAHTTHSYHQYSIVLEEGIERAKLMEFLREKGIATAIHYPRGIHQQPVFVDMYGSHSLPKMEYLAEHIMSLPVFHGLRHEDMVSIVDAVNEYFKQ